MRGRRDIGLLVVGAILLSSLAVLVPGSHSTDGWHTPSAVTGAARQEGAAVFFDLNDDVVQALRVTFPQPDIARFSYGTGAALPAIEPGSVTPTVTVDEDGIHVQTASLDLVVHMEPFTWELYDADGALLTGSGAAPISADPSGQWQSGSMPSYETPLSQLSLQLPTDHVYGLGQRFNLVDQSHWNLRSWICDCLQDGSYAARGNGYYVVPFFWTPDGWGGYLNSTADVEWDLGLSHEGLLTATDPSGLAPDLYLFGPGSPREVFDRYTDVTGKPTLPPRWSFEQWVDGVYGTEDGTIKGGADAMRSYLASFEEADIPVRSVVVEDWTTLWWFGARWHWNLANFPDPQGFVNELKNDGLKVMLWETPAVATANTEYPAAAQQGFFTKDSTGQPYVIHNANSGSASWWMEYVSIVDFTNPGALAWWREKHQPLLAMGIDGYKADGGEEVTPDMRFWDGSTGIQGHNRNARDYNLALYRDLIAARGEGAMESRSGTVGSQGASGIWNGDQSSGLSWVRNNLRAGLGASNAGLYWWTFDQGGLFGTMTREEFLRNLHVNVMSPWFKSHLTWDHPRAPWDYDAAALDTYRHYTDVRLQLLDYLYAEAGKAHDTGVPLTRILAVDYPDDAAAFDLWDEFLVGDRLLAAPQITGGATERNIHLPAGEWVDLTTGVHYEGPVDLVGYDTPQELLPLFWLEDANAPAPVLPAHPALAAGWTATATEQAPPGATASHDLRVETGFIAGPVTAGSPTTGADVTFAPPTGAGDAWLRLAWNPGPAFSWMQENFLNLKVYDANGQQLRDCGGGSQVLCRLDGLQGPAPWRANITVWTGHDINWELAIHTST